MSGPDTKLLTVLERCALAFAWTALGIALIVLVGYAFGNRLMTQMFFDTVYMTSNAAVVIMFIALALILRLGPQSFHIRLASAALTVVAGVVGFMVLLEHSLGVSLGIDLLLFPRLSIELANDLGLKAPGRFALPTAICVPLLALSVLLLDYETPSHRRPAQWLGLGIVAIGLFSFVRFLFMAELPPALVQYWSIAPHTALALTLLGSAVLLARPASGIMATFTSQGLGGVALRRLLPATLLFPLLVGALRLWGQQLGLYESNFGTAIYAVMMTFLFTAIFWWTAKILDALDERNRLQQAALRESEERYRNILETAQEGIWILDLKARTTYVNRRMQEMLGYQAEEMLGRPLYDFVDLTERPEAESHFARRMEGEVETYDFQLRRSDGATLWVIVSSTPLKDSDGRFIGVLKMIADITERREAEERIRRSQAALQNAQQVAHIGSWEWDIPTNTLTWSDEMCRIYGLDPATYVPSYEDYNSRIHPDDREAARAVVNKAYETCSAFHFEHRLVRPDGEVRYTESHGEVVAGPDGKAILMRGTGQDITARKLAELALLEQQQHFKSILDNAGMAIYGKDLQGRYFFANDNTAQALGLERGEELIGRLDADVIGPEAAAALRENDLLVIRSEKLITAEETLPLKDGLHYFLSTKFPMRDVHGTVIGMAGISPDISDRRRAEQEVREKSIQLEILNAEMQVALQELANSHQLLQEQAAALERSNTDLDDFAYIASHDLKEPLRGISNYANFLNEDYADKLDAEGRQMLETLPRLTKRLESLLDALLKYSRLNRAEIVPTATDLNDVVTDVKEMLEARIRENNAEVRVPRPLPTLMCDRSQTTEILLNLISNGIKYNDEEVKLIEVGYVDLETGETDPSIAELNGSLPGRYVFYVADNGIGIAEKYLDTVFGAFRRLHSRDKYGGGTGVGLAIVKKMVERQGGRIWVDSEPGQGSSFYFTLNPELVPSGGISESRAQ